MFSPMEFAITMVLAPFALFWATFVALSYLMDDHYGDIKWTRRERRQVCWWIMPFGVFYVLAYQFSLPWPIYFLLLLLHLVTALRAMWPIHQEHRRLQESAD